MATPDRAAAVDSMTRYIAREVQKGVPVKYISRHLLGLFQGIPGAKAWRRHLSENAWRDDGNVDLLSQALAAMQARVQ